MAKSVDVRKLLRDFEAGEYAWSGIARVPYWDQELKIWLYLDGSSEPTARQVRILQVVLSYRTDMRKPFEKALFEYYQSKVYGHSSFYDSENDRDVTDEHIPRLTKSSQIWRLLSDDAISISDRAAAEANVAFKMTFECTWDPEHGLAAAFRDWKVVRLGGQTEFD